MRSMLRMLGRPIAGAGACLVATAALITAATADDQDASSTAAQRSQVRGKAALLADQARLQVAPSAEAVRLPDGTVLAFGPGCLDCMPDDLVEPEPCGEDVNGGCNSSPPAFTLAACGETWCGTAWADAGSRDTDWYLVTLDQPGTLTATLESELPCVVFIVDGIDACLPAIVGVTGCSEGCQPIAAASADLPAGSYVVFVAAGVCGGGGIFEGYPCGGDNEYRVTIACDFPEPTGACCLPDGSCMDAFTEAECMALGGTMWFDGQLCAGAFAGYMVESIDMPFVDISATGMLVPIASASDDGGDVLPIGFSFPFWGVMHDTVGIGSNGYLTFGTDLSDFSNDPIPTTTDPNDLIAPWWDDWNPGAQGDVYAELVGDAFIVQWNGVTHFNGTCCATFQAILFADGRIDFRYLEPVFDSPTAGLENPDGTMGVAIDVNEVMGGTAWRFSPMFDSPIECPPPFVVAPLDIKPGSCPNAFNRKSQGKLPVAILGTMDFDVFMIDVASITMERGDGFGGAVAPLMGPPGPGVSYEDVATPFMGELCDCHEMYGDGFMDLGLKFSSSEVTEALMLGDFMANEDVPVVVRGWLLDGTPFEAWDCLHLVGRPSDG